LRAYEAQQLETWENEGGRTGVSTDSAQILIVDPDMRSAALIEHMLQALGYSETRVAYSGHAALAIAAEFRPGVVLLELDLLDMDGHELAPLLRHRAQSRQLRLIALTSSRQHAARDLDRSAGFERYLLKPIDRAGLSELLEVPTR
jgi:CheY-like chemotaxis protein